MVNALLNVIHPYIYKLQGETLVSSPIKSLANNHRRVSKLVAKALGNGRVIQQVSLNPNTLSGAVERVVLSLDPAFKWVIDERVAIAVTTYYGTPLFDNRPDDISPEDWERLRACYNSEDELRVMIGEPGEVVFIGGLLERCLTNAAAYHARYYCNNGSRLFYVPELCIKYSDVEWEEARPKLHARGVEPITYNEAMTIFKNRKPAKIKPQKALKIFIKR